MPLIEKFQFGFQAGAQTVNPNVTVLVGYAGKFNDPARGQELAISQMNGRADVLYHAAGGTGVGVIKAVAAKGAGYWAIGVDRDQDGEAPGRVLTSMVKRVDRAVFDAASKVASDDFERGEVVWGLKEDGIALSEMKYTKKDIPEEAMKQLEDIKKQIIDGKIAIPTTPRDYEDFATSK
jgi:basic membrane protein A